MKELFRSFAGGEITPELYGRLDLTKFQTGLRLCRNFITLPHGPAARRPGTRYVLQVKDSTRAVRVLPFQFSADESVVIEMGHEYARFHVNGATVLEDSKAIVSISGDDVQITAHDYSVGDWLFIGGQFFIVSVVPDANNVTVTDLRAGAAAVPVSATTAARVYTITTPYDSADVFAIHFAQNNDVLTLTHPSYKTRELRRMAAADWDLALVDFSPNLAPPSTVSATATVAVSSNLSTQRYVVTAVDDDGVTQSLVSSIVSAVNNLTLAGNFNTIRWDPRVGDSRYNVYKQRGGSYGYIGQTPLVAGATISSQTNSGTTATVNTATNHGLLTGDRVTVAGATPAAYNGSFTITRVDDDTFTYVMLSNPGASASPVGTYVAIRAVVDDNVVPDLVSTPPENIYTLNTEADGGNDLPAAVTYHEQRRWFAGTNTSPQSIFATRNGTEANLTSSVPAQADDGLRFRVAAQQQNRIRHMVPLSDLIVFTANAEWRVYADNEPSITPASLTVKPLGYSGANDVQPVVTSGSILYVQAQGSRVRELGFAEGGYRSIDMSIMAPHLFNSLTIVDLTYSRSPEQIAWAVRSDGKLLGLTYVPEQQVFGWHQHDTDGLFESVTTVAEGNEDALYAVVKRTIDSVDVRYIERLQTRLFGAQANAYFVDCGLTYSGAPAAVFSGLGHLEGKTVQILADGAVEEEREVVNGTITLANAASVVRVGLKYQSDLQTLPLAFETTEAAGQGMLKNVLAAHLRIVETSLFQAGPSFTNLIKNRSRAVSDPFDSSPTLKTKEERISVPGNWNTDGSICVRQDQPLPCTIVAMTLEVEGGD